MHSQRPHEIPFQHPESLCQQQRSRHFHGHAIHHLAPELTRHQRVERLLRHRIFCPRRNRSARPRQRKPQPLHMPFRQHHGSIESNNREPPRHMQNHLDHVLAHISLRVIQLRRVVPRKRGPIIPVIHIPRSAVAIMPQPKHHRRIRLIVIMILKLDLDAAIGRQIRPLKTVSRERTLPPRNKPVRILNHPIRINPHMIRHHIAGQSQPRHGRAILQILVSLLAPQIFRNRIILQRVSRSHRLAISPQPLNGLRRATPLPQSNQP